IHRLKSPLAGALRLDEALLLARRHPPGCQSAAHRLQLRHDLEHLHHPVGSDLSHDGASSRRHLDQALRGELEECLAERRPGDLEALCEPCLVEAHSRWVAAGDDSLLDHLPDAPGSGACILLHSKTSNEHTARWTVQGAMPTKGCYGA